MSLLCGCWQKLIIERELFPGHLCQVLVAENSGDAVGLSAKNYILSVDKAIIKVLYVLLSQYYFLHSWINNVRGYGEPLLICKHQGPQADGLLGWKCLVLDLDQRTGFGSQWSLCSIGVVWPQRTNLGVQLPEIWVKHRVTALGEL